MKKELKERTNKFDHIIDLCRNILTDIHECSSYSNINSNVSSKMNTSSFIQFEDTSNESQLRLQYVRDKTELLLETFNLFRQTD